MNDTEYSAEFPEDVWTAFHHVWTFAVGKPGYKKETFIGLENELLRMHRESLSVESDEERRTRLLRDTGV